MQRLYPAVINIIFNHAILSSINEQYLLKTEKRTVNNLCRQLFVNTYLVDT